MAGKNGGARPGAGRKPGKMNDARIMLAIAARNLKDEALEALKKNLSDQNGSVRNAAATEILNRGFGKAPQEIIIEDGTTDTAVAKPKGLSELLGMAEKAIRGGEENDPEVSG